MPTPTTDIKQEFYSPLGVVRCGLSCSQKTSAVGTKKYENGSSVIFSSEGHNIEMVSFKIKVPLYNGDTLTDSFGWVFRIEKTADIDERISAYCLLDKMSNAVMMAPDTGENLDAITAYNEEWNLHLGSEDGEIIKSRAEAGDWFPPRLKDKVGIFESITEMKANGFVTNTPALKRGEKIHLQYLAAYDRRDEQQCNTWLAVDKFKRELESWIGIW